MIGYQIDWTPEKMATVLRMIQPYFEKYHCGESVMQRDSAQIEGLELLANLADEISPQRWEVTDVLESREIP